MSQAKNIRSLPHFWRIPNFERFILLSLGQMEKLPPHFERFPALRGPTSGGSTVLFQVLGP